jgi:hypothetical protein
MNEEVYLRDNLALSRCPHCGIAKPFLRRHHAGLVSDGTTGQRWWYMYSCTVCGGVVLAAAIGSEKGRVTEYYPSLAGVSGNIPDRPKEYLRQARESLGQPAGAIMLCASAVDSMLKDKGLKEGSLYERINKAAKDNLITQDMAKWAHQVRLDANDQRHIDQAAALPLQQDAERCLSFALALAEVLYVIPARVTRGSRSRSRSNRQT